MKIAIVELFAGLGTLTDPIVRGLSKHAAVAVSAGLELDARYLGLFAEQHPEASTAAGDLTSYAPEVLSFWRGNATKVLICGIPCTGASKAGRSKNRLGAPEEHEKVGHLFIPTLHFIARHHPEVIVFENVPEYASSYSAARIRETLSSLGYLMTERVVNPHSEFNTPTERKRWVMVATAKTVGAFQWLYVATRFDGTLAAFLDQPGAADADDEATEAQVAADSKYIARKQSEGCGFAMRLIDGASKKCPTICRSYGKRQPSATFVRTSKSYRMLRPVEVARIHRHSPAIQNAVAKLPATTAYEVLGQGVVAPPFESLGEALGAFLTGVRTEQTQPTRVELGQTEMAFG